MARLLAHQISPEEACAYLPGLCAAQEYQILMDVTAADVQAMLERGWRRFGPVYFRPACAGCMACVSLRVPVADFAPSKSQRRAAGRRGMFQIKVSPPVCDPSRLGLYAAWHRERERARGWRPNPMS